MTKFTEMIKFMIKLKILKLASFKMFSIKLLKVKGIHESLPTAWESNNYFSVHVSTNFDKYSIKIR